MIDKANTTYTKVKTAVNSLIKGSSQTYTDTLSDFPYMYFNQVDNPETSSDLDGNENAVKPMTEITVYTKGETKLTDAKKVMGLVDTQMHSLGYQRIFGPQQIPNLADTTMCRLLSRYSRVIGNGDIL
jgi:hypothetical protein